MNLSAVEKAMLPIVGPFILQLWQGTLYPAIQKAASGGASPEIAVLEAAGLAALNQIVLGELQALGVSVPAA